MDKSIHIITYSESQIVEKIQIIRAIKVMLDKDLADMYGVEVKVLNQAVKRNSSRFPEDFMFQLTEEEAKHSRSQFVTLNKRGSNIKYLPFAFTEQGVAMLSSVLRSETAIQVNIQIIRVYTKMKQLLFDNKELWQKIEKIEESLFKKDEEIQTIFNVLKQLLLQKEKVSKPVKRNPIGFPIPSRKN